MTCNRSESAALEGAVGIRDLRTVPNWYQIDPKSIWDTFQGEPSHSRCAYLEVRFAAVVWGCSCWASVRFVSEGSRNSIVTQRQADELTLRHKNKQANNNKNKPELNIKADTDTISQGHVHMACVA
jgi:hypothetical protein